MSRKLTDEMRDAAIARIVRGQSLQSVAEWIGKAHSVTISKQALHQLVKTHGKNLADGGKSAVRGVLAPKSQKRATSLERRLAAATKIVREAEKFAVGNPLTGIELHAKAVGSWAKLQALWQEAVGLTQVDDPVVDGVEGLLGLILKRENDAFDVAIAAQDPDAVAVN